MRACLRYLRRRSSISSRSWALNHINGRTESDHSLRLALPVCQKIESVIFSTLCWCIVTAVNQHRFHVSIAQWLFYRTMRCKTGEKKRDCFRRCKLLKQSRFFRLSITIVHSVDKKRNLYNIVALLLLFFFFLIKCSAEFDRNCNKNMRLFKHKYTDNILE